VSGFFATLCRFAPWLVRPWLVRPLTLIGRFVSLNTGNLALMFIRNNCLGLDKCMMMRMNDGVNV